MKHGLFTKKKIILLVCLALGASLLFACCEALPGDELYPDNEGEDGAKGAHVSDYILVRGDNSGNEVLRQVLELKSAIDERFDTDARSSTDWAVDAESSGAARWEILVGETNRSESIAVNGELEGINGYIIRTVGDKIVITASTTGLLKEAVSRFTRDYLDKSEDGTLPATINVQRTVENPLGVMSDTTCMKMALSVRATEALRHAVKDFATRIYELSGVYPSIIYKAEVPMEKVYITFKDTVFSKEDEGGSSVPEATGSDMWQLTREGDEVILEGESELQLIAGLAGLYETLEKRADRTLDGKTVFFYNRSDDRKESWQSTLPRLVGGRYLGSESISGDCTGWYYENVSLADLCDWKLLILEPALGPCQTLNNTGDYAQYVNYAENVEISVYYNSDARTLSINERRMS